MRHRLLALVLLLASSPVDAAGKAPPCLLIGDENISGMAPALIRMIGPCAVQARAGASSTDAMSWPAPAAEFKLVVIGLGAHDRNMPRLARNLTGLRKAIEASRVLWLRPYRAVAGQVVQLVAERYADGLYDLRQLPSRDGVRPVSYTRVAQTIAGASGRKRPKLRPASEKTKEW
ncbi:hypothetical protein Q4F19_08215 [Sphingomonas sp. BIUV-7]|uniref:Uncharacterized protein n=1 Tax=Sphingomonas natans TaxID=3063330 RepID=A0ABT8Y7S2_9SPHN|nr:hypothetical protein [Sphingomonas sp. BIUV-7]MDO6414362.1 hypothetical protein [Sphingomonas sp. BIUV-7]